MIFLQYKARVLWVDKTTVKIGLTLLPDIVKGVSQIPSLEIGDIIEKATIVHVDGSNALMLDLGDNIRGYAPVREFAQHKWKFSRPLLYMHKFYKPSQGRISI